MQVVRDKAAEITALDDIDREILRTLVRNARVSYRELGERISLSANATAERVRRLTAGGVIAGFTAVVDPAAAGRTLVALVDVRLQGPADADRFEQLVESLDEVIDLSHVTGRFDYALRVACRDIAGLDALIRTLKTEGGVAESDTRIALRTVVSRARPMTPEST
jgi:Lrp/AsnC family transcriptional regulator, leucine-responsive regulatory protein